MTRRKQTRGKCHFCGREMTRGGMAKHLETCPKHQEAVQAADQESGEDQTLFHLQVQDAWSGAYWLYLEMTSSAKLKDLDKYLRAIWLECCGHLSQFSVGDWGEERSPCRGVQIRYSVPTWNWSTSMTLGLHRTLWSNSLECEKANR